MQRVPTDDTTSASSASSPPFLPSPCPLTTERSPPAAADDGAATNEDDRDEQDTNASAGADWGLWYIHGRAYDLTGFMDQHPGASAGLQRQAVGDTQNRSID
jgi:hypothetical protein